ncbi:MAG: DUF4145 domain-containing protein [Alphaproteobacteria bacterium]|nr:MAG: DUF4145 domain-containing protein [Alphaproteobacteria bacterium]
MSDAPFLIYDCPHCLQPNARFTLVQEMPRYERDPSRGMVSFWRCSLCGLGMTALNKESVQIIFSNKNSFPRRHNPKIGISALRETWPKPYWHDAPGYLSDGVKKLYLEACENRKRDNLNGACMLFRRTLEVALKTAYPHPDDTPKHSLDLKKRIKWLAGNGVLTRSLYEWADEIRELGNGAAHSIETPSVAAAEDLETFTRLVLQYVFTLPEAVRLQREQRNLKEAQAV